MSYRTKSEDEPKPGAHAAAAGPTGWNREPPLDHHIEEVLGAFSAIASLRLQARPDASA